MKFDWRYLTENEYKYVFKAGSDYIGSVHIGDICIELIMEHGGTWIRSKYNPVDNAMFNFYVAHEDTGYGYKDDTLPYDYADGIDIEIPYDMTYEEFKVEAEKMFVKYIEAYKGKYSLVDHANKPLEIW